MAAENEEPEATAPSTNPKKRNGNKPARQQLLLELDMQRQAQDFSDSRQHDYFLSEPYTPSTKGLSELEAISISDLEIDTHHWGKLLIVRALDDGCRLTGVQTVIEDEAGEADRFIFYNSDAGLESQEIVPEDAIFAIKEPFYTSDSGCGVCIRVDHPSDLVRMNLTSSKVPSSIRDALMTPESSQTIKTASDWKADGNALYKAGDYRAAAEAYTEAVSACTSSDEGLKRDVLRNRAIVNTYLRRFEAAQADASDAVIADDSDDKATALNAKAFFRAGRAAYELRHFAEAETFFKKVKELTPADKDALGELSRIEQRLKEQATGEYDFTTMSKSSSEKHNRLDFADFTSNTEIKDAKGRGRGLFATKALATGDLVLCEKAFSVAFDSDREASRKYNIFNSKSERRSAGTQAILLFNLTQKLLYNPQLATRLFDLSAGDYTEKSPLQPVDGIVPVDTFRVNGIIDHNSFACPTVRSSSKAARDQSANAEHYHSTGLWLHASYINHGCDANCMRSFIGDMIIIRAAKDIAPGEEILMPYLLPDRKNEEFQTRIQKVFGFRCDCSICVADQALSAEQRNERAEIVDKLDTILSANPFPSRQQQDRRTVAQIERLASRFEAFYDSNFPSQLPRLGLISPGIWLCQAYLQNSGIPKDKVLKTALSVLRNMGFMIKNEDGLLNIDRSNAIYHGSVIEVAMHAARIYSQQGRKNAPLADQMVDFAKSVYLVMNGELRGFEQQFGRL